MSKSPFKSNDFFKSACYFEASLVLVAIILGWVADINPFQNIYFSEAAITYGLIGTIPLFLMFLALEKIQGGSVVKIRELLLDTLGPGLHRYRWTDLFLLAAIAGIAEELLFRGVIQPWIEGAWGLTAGLVVSNVVFGLVHAVTPLYAVLAALVGFYLGLSLDYGGERNLLIPVIIHGFYDFLAFVALMRVYRSSLTASTKD
ncbi:CPBP family intramembrane glutamic endopeptidase [Methylobacter sp. S3L5C]|uniref:CPBP family intramembrane glutamic endopeptidase n=1 Tax=Methylobacter sp. S3L5C TaxID=2839024 RepID=UPI001FABA409|nr:CPBP family intramembrane glutamic endopeptidase [Methylobacter sp. S3L5C]UOA07242.1 CPBP family intramembrane metalloprotease [Methylobacter sp. S3L5C]